MAHARATAVATGKVVASTAASTHPAIRLTTGVRGEAVVDRLDVDVPSGAVCSFLGPDGARKRTASDLFPDLIRPSAGRATLVDREGGAEAACRSRPDPRRRDAGPRVRMGMVFVRRAPCFGREVP